MLKLFILFFCFLSPVSAEERRSETWKKLPVQHQGRVKPFDTFCREILKEIYGKEKLQKKICGRCNSLLGFNS